MLDLPAMLILILSKRALAENVARGALMLKDVPMSRALVSGDIAATVSRYTRSPIRARDRPTA
jgi:hypothetical protein